MKDIIKTRIFHWKKQWLSITFWLLLPIIGTILIMFFSETVKEEVQVPVGIVLEDDSLFAHELVKSIEQSPLIRTIKLSNSEALYRLTKHELDSIFIIHKGYEEKIKNHDRHQLLTSYYTDLSFAYPTIKEIVISFVQQETSRSKAAQTVRSLAKQSGEDGRWTWEEIVSESKITQEEQDLLNTSFSFYTTNNGTENNENISLIKGWNIWAILALLATFLLLDWPSKEAHSKVRSRFPFIRMRFKKYLFLNLFIYIFIFIVIDSVTLVAFHYLLDEKVSLIQYGTIVTYRLMICFGAFLLSICFKRVYSYYLVAFFITLFLTISSGVILPLDGLLKYFHVLKWINPLNGLITNSLSVIWLIIFISITIVWLLRKERLHASS